MTHASAEFTAELAPLSAVDVDTVLAGRADVLVMRVVLIVLVHRISKEL